MPDADLKNDSICRVLKSLGRAPASFTLNGPVRGASQQTRVLLADA